MRYLITFSYDGTRYKGFQKQTKGKARTIQTEIENVLFKINSNREVSISATGRTDAGVHAINQKAHFDLDKKIDINKIKDSMNQMLPDDIYVKKVEVVDDDFHARYNVKAKEYIYKVNIGEYNPIEKDYVYQYNKELDIKKMKEATTYLIGEHDFSSFTKDSKEYETCVREIFSIDIKQDDNIITFIFKGNGFLRYMVRNIVGTLIDVGSNKIEPNKIESILLLKDRRKAGKTVPGCGLYLNNVKY